MIVDCNPEFGIELALALPYAYWLHEQGELEKVVTSHGMQPFYYFCDFVEEKYDHRTIDNEAAGLNSLPNNWIYGNIHNAKLYKDEWEHWEQFMCEKQGCGILNYEKWKMPDYSSHYKNDRFVFEKPFVVVSNRFNWEHGGPPVGYFDPNCLIFLFRYLTEKGYIVIYKRPRNTEFPVDQNERHTLMTNTQPIFQYNKDGQEIKFSDYDIANDFEDVILLDELVSKNTDLTYNELQLNLFANASSFVAISGGSTLLLNLFQKPTITYLYNGSDLRRNFWEGGARGITGKGPKNIKNYYYMMNPNLIPFIDKDCQEMREHKYDRFFKLIEESIK